jgi:hypothetical protein
MTRRTRIMRGLSRAAHAAAFMILGGQALAQYLIYTEPAFTDRLRPLSSILQLAFFVFAIAGSSLDRRNTGSDLKEPSPRYSGVSVVVITGMTATMAVGRSSYLYALIIATGTIVAAAAVWRFATTHATEIGEARFRSPSAAE